MRCTSVKANLRLRDSEICWVKILMYVGHVHIVVRFVGIRDTFHVVWQWLIAPNFSGYMPRQPPVPRPIEKLSNEMEGLTTKMLFCQREISRDSSFPLQTVQNHGNNTNNRDVLSPTRPQHYLLDVLFSAQTKT